MRINSQCSYFLHLFMVIFFVNVRNLQTLRSGTLWCKPLCNMARYCILSLACITYYIAHIQIQILRLKLVLIFIKI